MKQTLGSILVLSLATSSALATVEDEARALAHRALREGEQRIAAGQPAEAARILAEARAALARLPRGDSEKERWERILAGLIGQAEQGIVAEKEARSERLRRMAEAEALREQAALEDARRLRAESLLRQAEEALSDRRWEAAEGLAGQVAPLLPADPRPGALALAARECRHVEEGRRLQASAGEESWALRASSREQGIPYNAQVLRYPEGWASAHRGRGNPEADAALREAPWKQVLREKLSRRVHYRFSDVPFRDAVAFLEAQGRLTVNVDRLALQALPGLDETPVRLTSAEDGTTLESALNALAGQVGLAWTLRDETLVFTTAEGLEEEDVLVSYDLRDVLVRIKDYPGPKITLGENQPGSTICFPEEEPEEEGLDSEQLLEFIQAIVDQGSKKP